MSGVERPCGNLDLGFASPETGTSHMTSLHSKSKIIIGITDLFQWSRDTRDMKVFCKLASAVQMTVISCAHSVHFPLSGLKNTSPQSRSVLLCAQTPPAQQPARRCHWRSKGGHETSVHPATSCLLWGKRICALSKAQPWSNTRTVGLSDRRSRSGPLSCHKTLSYLFTYLITHSK